MKNYDDIKSFDELIELEHGKTGAESRNRYEESSQMFIISEMLKEARKEANLTQEQLAEKTGTKKAISQRLRMAKVISSFPHLSGYLKLGLTKELA